MTTKTTRYPSGAPQRKPPPETRSCKGCGLTVMAKGDWHGWKGVDMGNGQMDWFCDKLPCRQKRDETIARRSQEMVAEQAKHRATVAESQELERLRARVAELEAAAGQTTAPDDDHLSDAGKAAKALEQNGLPDDFDDDQGDQVSVFEDVSAPAAAASAPVEVHLTGADGKSLCGGTGPSVPGSELTWDSNPCTKCATRWAKIQTGEEPEPPPAAAAPAAVDTSGHPPLFSVRVPSSSDKSKSYEVKVLASGEWHCECEGFRNRQKCRHLDVGKRLYTPPPAAAAAPVAPPADMVDETMRVNDRPASAAERAALYGERPAPPTLDQLPRFTPSLIEKVSLRPGDHIGVAILIPPSAYEEVDMAEVDPEQFRSGVSALFSGAGLEVDRIERASRGAEVAGVVFTLKTR